MVLCILSTHPVKIIKTRSKCILYALKMVWAFPNESSAGAALKVFLEMQTFTYLKVSLKIHTRNPMHTNVVLFSTNEETLFAV